MHRTFRVLAGFAQIAQTSWSVIAWQSEQVRIGFETGELLVELAEQAAVVAFSHAVGELFDCGVSEGQTVERGLGIAQGFESVLVEFAQVVAVGSRSELGCGLAQVLFHVREGGGDIVQL